MKKYLGMCLVAILVPGLVSATVLKIDFEELPYTGTTEIVSGDLDSKTFTFSSSNSYALIVDTSGGLESNPTHILWMHPSSSLIMENTAGDLFTLYSFDIMGVYSSGEVLITGYRADGETVTTTLNVESNNNMTYHTGSEWTRLSRVEFGNLESWGIAVDNLVVAPIPATVWLFGSALVGLGWMRRRQAA